MPLTDQFRPLLSYVLAMLVFALLDARLGADISLWVLFLLPIGWATWNLGQAAGFVLVVLAGFLLLGVDEAYGSRFSAQHYLVLSVVFKVVAYGVVSRLVGLLRANQVERVHVPAVLAQSQ